MAERVRIASASLTAEIDPLGAELQSLRDAYGHELMWGGDPAFWTGRAPLLFPIVGRLNGDAYRIDGQSYAMAQHGFARRSTFEIVEAGLSDVRFRLRDSIATRAIYPFAFELDVHFRLDDATLRMAVTVRNTGDAPLPASFGYHPAFAWPLPFGAAREEHRIAFEQPEPAPLCALKANGLIGAETRATPVNGKTLMLDDALFAHDALVWRDLNSRRLRYGAARGTALDIAFPDTSWLGIWTKPGAGYVCIEPWAGMADTHGFDGDFREKPGIFEVAPGAERSFRMDVTLTPG